MTTEVDVSLRHVIDCCWRVVDAGAPIPDWRGADLGRVYAISSKTRTTPIVALAASDEGIEVPYWFREASSVHREYWRHRIEDALLAAHAASMALRNEGISHAFRKGVDVVHRYPDVGLRPFADLDLIVASRDVALLEPVFRQLGYEPAAVSRRQFAFMRLGLHVAPGFKRKRSVGRLPSFVDVSTALLIPALAERWAGNRLPFEELRIAENAYRSPGRAAVLAPPILLLDLVINYFVGCTTMRYVNRLRFQRLTMLIDLVLVARTLTGSDWDHFDALVEKCRSGPALRYALGTGVRLFGWRFAKGWSPAAREHIDPDAPELDEYGAIEFGTPVRWEMPFHDRLLLDRLPTAVPRWSSPI